MVPKIFTTSGLAYNGAGTLLSVAITSPGATSPGVTIYDGTGAAGTVLYSGDGAVEFADDGLNVPFKIGCYVSLTGTTKPTVEVVVS